MLLPSFLDSSCKSTWVLLSGSTILKSREYIGRCLEQNASKIVKGISIYKERPANINEEKELTELKGICSEGIPPIVIQRLSKHLNIDSQQTWDLLVSYLVHEFTGSSKNLSSSFTSDKSEQQLMREVTDFFLSERLFSLFCLKEILSNWKQPDSTHPYKVIFEDFMTSVHAKDNHLILSSILKQLDIVDKKYQSLQDASPIDKSSDADNKWISQVFRERSELIQLLILCVGQMTPRTEDVIKILRMSSEFILSRPTRMLVGSCDKDLVDIVSILPVLESSLILRCFQLDTLYGSIEDEENQTASHFLLENGLQLKAVDQLVRERNSSSPTSGIIFLGWILVRSIEIEHLNSNESAEVIKQLGTAIVNLDIFSFVDKFLTSDPFEKFFSKTRVGRDVKSTFGSTLNILFKVYQLEQMVGTKKSSLFDLSSTLLSEDSNAFLIFDSGDSDSGLLSVIRTAVSQITVNPLPFLKMSVSLASTSSSLQLVTFLSSLDSLVEKTTTVNPHLSFNSSSRCYVSRIDRHISLGETTSVVIKQGSIGKVLRYHPDNITMDILWTDVSFSGWSYLRDLYKIKIDGVSTGRISASTEVYETLIMINQLCEKVIKSTEGTKKIPFEVKEILRTTVEAFKLVSRFSNPPRVFIASILKLLSSYANINRKEGLAIWKIIQDITLFPYLVGGIGAGHASNLEISSSTTGQLIVKEECTSGKFDLCNAFLTLVDTMIDLVDLDDTMMACVVFVLTEIFPVYRLWSINRSQDAKIGLLCYSIAHKVVSMVNTSPRAEKLISFTRTTLMTGSPGEALLDTVRRGRTIVSEIILFQGVDSSLLHPDVLLVRLALSILNQLLLIREKIEKTKKKGDSKGSTLETQSKSVNVVEDALFNTKVSHRELHLKISHNRAVQESSQTKHYDNDNMLITLCDYVFQPFDFRLAVLGGQVLKRLAKCYPMSMLACLGSASDSVKEHFLFRLESVTEDIRVKVSLLDFLSVCIQHQPGLIELFVSEENNSSIGENKEKKEDSFDSPNVLQTVLDILREKKEGVVLCPSDLHVAAIRFLCNLWLSGNHATIESLKKNRKIWTLICFPLMEESGSHASLAGNGEGRPDIGQDDISNSDKLFSYLLKLISREIFFKATAETGKSWSFSDDNKLDDSLVQIIKGHLPSRAEECSYHIKDLCSKGPIDDFDDTFLLITGWRDLLVTVAKIDSSFFSISTDLKRTILTDLLEGLQKQIERGATFDVLMPHIEAALLVFGEWSRDANGPSGIFNLQPFQEKWITTLTAILFTVSERKDEVSLAFLLSLKVLLIKTIHAVRQLDETLSLFSLVNWISPVTQLFIHSLRMMEVSISSPDSSSTTSGGKTQIKLVKVSLSCLNILLSATSSFSESWIPAISSASLIEYLSFFVLSLVQNSRHPDIVSSSILLFSTFSSIRQLVDSVLTSSPHNLSWVSAVFKSIDASESTSGTISPWNSVYLLTLKFLSSLLLERGHFFIRDALHLITQNLDRLMTCLRTFRTRPTRAVVIETLQTLLLTRLLIGYKTFWMTNFPLSFEVLMTEVSMTCYAVTAYARKPLLFQYMIHNSSLIGTGELSTTVGSSTIISISSMSALQSPSKNPLGTSTSISLSISSTPSTLPQKSILVSTPSSVGPSTVNNLVTEPPSKAKTVTFSPHVDRRIFSIESSNVADSPSIAPPTSAKVQPSTTLDSDVDAILTGILCTSLVILSRALPSLKDVLEERKKKGKPSPSRPLPLHLEVDFTSPALELNNKISSFGSILKAIELLVSKLSIHGSHGMPISSTLIEGTSMSHFPSNRRQLIRDSLESGVSLLVSQSLVSQLDSSCPTDLKESISSKVKSDVSSILSPLTRTHKRSSLGRSPSTGGSIHSTPLSTHHSQSPDYPFIKTICEEVVDKIL